MAVFGMTRKDWIVLPSASCPSHSESCSGVMPAAMQTKIWDA